MKNSFTRRTAVLTLIAALVLSGSASALFGKKQEPPTAEAGAPTVQDLEIKTYRGIPYQAQFLAADNEGDEMTFSLVEQPRKGVVVIEGDAFTYTPDEGITGGDSFTYAATDSAGHTSLPATVKVSIDKARSGVTYADTAGSPAAAAAQGAEPYCGAPEPGPAAHLPGASAPSPRSEGRGLTATPPHIWPTATL